MRTFQFRQKLLSRMMVSVSFVRKHVIVLVGMPDYMRMCRSVMRMGNKMLVLMQMGPDQSISYNKDGSHKHDQGRYKIQRRQSLS